jgi:hypothetical protein
VFAPVELRLERFGGAQAEGQAPPKIAFEGGPVQGHDIEAGFFGNFVRTANELYAELCKSIGVASPVLRLGMTSESSYAIDVKVPDREEMQTEIFPTDKAFRDEYDKSKRALDWLMSLIVDQQAPESVIGMLKLDYGLRQRYGQVLEILNTKAATVSVRTRTRPKQRRVSGLQAGERLRVLRELGYPYQHLLVRGRLIGGLVEKVGRRDTDFTIRVEVPQQQPREFNGDIAVEAVEKMRSVKFEDEVEAKLQISQDEKAREQGYTLVDIHVVQDGSPHSVR